MLSSFAVAATLLICFAAGHVGALTIQIMPSQKQCFFEHLKQGERMMVGFQVEKLELDFWVVGPRENRIANVVNSHGYEHTFEAESDGKYTYCFHNTAYTLPARDVTFYTYRDDKDKSQRAAINADPLQRELNRLKEGLQSVKEEQYYLTIRERAHRDTAESTNSRVVWWSILQTLMLAGTCVWQVFYLKRFFEVKRTV